MFLNVNIVRVDVKIFLVCIEMNRVWFFFLFKYYLRFMWSFERFKNVLLGIIFYLVLF